MVISIFIHKEEMKWIKGVITIKICVHGLAFFTYTKQMSSTNDAVEVYNCHEPWAIWIEVRLNYPHASVLVWFFGNTGVPLHKRAGIGDAGKFKREELSDTSDFKTTHPDGQWIGVDENAVIPMTFLPPIWHGTNVFRTHTSNTRDVTGGIESCNGWSIQSNFFMEWREAIWNVIDARMVLNIDKLVDKINEIW